MKNPTHRLPESNMLSLSRLTFPKKTSLLATIVARRGKVPFPPSQPATTSSVTDKDARAAS